MSFHVHNVHGVWMVSRDSDSIVFPGGAQIDYELYKQLRDVPHESDKHFKLDKTGKVVAIAKRSETAQD